MTPVAPPRRLLAAGTLLAAAVLVPTAANAAATPRPQALLDRYVAIVNSGQLADLDAVVADDFTQTTAGVFPTFGTGPELLRTDLAALRTGFPDLRYTVEHRTSRDDTITASITVTGTHRGNYAGVAPTGRPVKTQATETLRIRNGHIIRC